MNKLSKTIKILILSIFIWAVSAVCFGTSVWADEIEETVSDIGIPPETGDEELGKLIGDFLRSQSETVRNVFLRRYWFFDSVSDIAKRYSFSESKVKSMLFHTRNKLRDYLKKEGFEL